MARACVPLLARLIEHRTTENMMMMMI